MFLGFWFIRKAMWASQSSIKGNATSLKKLYTFNIFDLFYHLVPTIILALKVYRDYTK